MKKVSEVTKRFLEVFQELEMGKKWANRDEVAGALGVKKQTFTEILGGRMQATVQIIQNFCMAYAVNPAYLLLGQGPKMVAEMGMVKEQEASYSMKVKPIVKANVNLTTLQPAVITVNEAGKDNIVFVDVKAAAGYPEMLQEPKLFKKLPTFQLPDGRLRNGTFRCFEVQGDSMEDTLFSGDRIIGQQITDFQEIIEGYVHIIVTKTDVMVKRLLNRAKERGKLVLISDNSAYRPKEINADDVLELWLGKTYFRFDLQNRNRDIPKKVLGLEADLQELAKRIAKLEKGKGGN